MNEVDCNGYAGRIAVQPTVTGRKSAADKVGRDGSDILAGVPDDFEHLRRVCGGEMEFERLGAVPTLSLVGVKRVAVIVSGVFTGANRRKVADGIEDGDGALMAFSRKQILVGDNHFRAVFVPDGRAVAEMSGLRESDARTLFQADEDQSLPPLRDAEVGGVEQAPIAIVAQPGKAFDDLGDGLSAFVRGESDDVFHDESPRAEVVHEVGELLKKAVARVVFIR